MTLPPVADCAAWYKQAFQCDAVVMTDSPSVDLSKAGGPSIRSLDALTTLRWISRPVSVAPRLLALAANGATAIVLHNGVDALSGDVLVAPRSDDGSPLGEQLAALGIPFEVPRPEADGKKQLIVAQASLASALAFAVVAESEAPGVDDEAPAAPSSDELPLDIYASEFISLITPFGAPLEAIWHVDWELGGVRWCLLNADLDVEETQRIPYRQALSAADFMAALRACNAAGLHYLTLPVCVLTSPSSGHVIHLETIDDDEVVFHDPWPGRSMLAAGNNTFGIAAKPWTGPTRRWCVTPDELQRVAYASLVEPAVWLPICGVRTDVRYSELSQSEFVGFFHLSEVSRTSADDGGLVSITLKPGRWQERITIVATVDPDDCIRSATLTVDRAWLTAPDTAPFATDLLSHFVGAAVTEADMDEVRLLRGGLRGIATGQLEEALSAGPAHLLNHFRLVALTVAGAAPFARAMLPCSTLRAVNTGPADGGDEPQLTLVVSRPQYEPGALFEDQRSGYFMDEYREYLWRKSVKSLHNLTTLGHT